MARKASYCLCGRSGPTAEESMCRPCRRRAVDEHGTRLISLLNSITYDHRDVRLSWVGPDASAAGFTPRVEFQAPDILDPQGPPILWRGFRHWEDDQLIAACAAGADDEQILALGLAQAHYAIAVLAVHEVGEWYTYRGAQVYPPHRTDPYLPLDEDNGPDGNGQVVLWLTYDYAAGTRADHAATGIITATDQRPVEREEIGALPEQTLLLRPEGVTVVPRASTVVTNVAWSAPHAHEDRTSAALRDIHHAMVMSELIEIARNLNLSGKPVLARTPSSNSHNGRITWDACLTYDG